jgi:hypothetical protein
MRDFFNALFAALFNNRTARQRVNPVWGFSHRAYVRVAMFWLCTMLGATRRRLSLKLVFKSCTMDTSSVIQKLAKAANVQFIIMRELSHEFIS